MSNPVSPIPSSQAGHNSLQSSESTDVQKNEKNMAVGKVIEKTFIALSTHPHSAKRRSATRPERKHEKEETVTKEFVEEYNNTIGSKSLQEKAERLIEKMKRFGGLLAHSNPKELDINSARRGLAVLAGIKNNDTLKLDILNSLYALIKADPYKEESAQGLVSVILALNEHMDIANLQSETPQAQLALVKVYGATARLIIFYQSQKQTNAITTELKAALTKTISDLAKINQAECVKLNYHLQYALEGIVRIKDDMDYLEVVLKMLFHLSMAAAGYEFQTDLTTELKKVFQTMDSAVKLRSKSAWYDCCLSMVPLSKGALTDIDLLVALQEMINKHGKKQDWRFLYTSIKILQFIVLNGKDKSIRRKALQGWKTQQVDLPGILSFLSFEGSKKFDLKKTRFTNTGLPQALSPTKIIQKRCVEQLIKVWENSEDPIIKTIMTNHQSTILEKKQEFNIQSQRRKIINPILLEETESTSPPKKTKRTSDSATRKIAANRLSVDLERMRDFQQTAKNLKRHSETAVVEITLEQQDKSMLKRSASFQEAGTPRSLDEKTENI